MSSRTYNEADLEAFLDEALAADEMASIERALRASTKLSQLLVQINSRRDAGVHTLGEIWRRHRLSCPTREQMGSYLLQALDDEQLEYIRFHIETVGCRFCEANLADLKRQQAESQQLAKSRQQRYFQSSAGLLKPED